MELWSDLVKNLKNLRGVVLAVFVAATTLRYGPLVATWMDAAPKEIAPFLFPAIVASGVLLVGWLLAWIWNAMASNSPKITKSWRMLRMSRTKFTEPEEALIYVLAKDPAVFYDLSHIDYSSAPASKLQFHAIAEKLEARGLIRIHESDEDLLLLTPAGRRKALELEKSDPR